LRTPGQLPPLWAVDISTLHPRGAGISRYLRALLPRMVRLRGDGEVRWRAYGRGQWQLAGLDPQPAGAAGIELRADHLPDALGRLTSLAVQIPFWSRRDRPALYWAPAHRLPVSLPPQTRTVLTVHDLCWRFAPETMRLTTRWLDRGLMRPSIARADAIVAISRATATELIALCPSAADKTTVIPLASGMAAPTGAPQSVDARLKPMGYLLFVGTCEPRKNLQRLIRAHALSFARHGLPLVVVGGQGWRAAGIERALKAGEAVGRLIRLGRVGDGDLAVLYAHARCLMCPSLYEGFGLPLLEAMAFGTPVVTANRGACREVAGEGGILVNPESVEEIAAAILRIVEEPALRNALSGRARQVAARYDWDESAKVMVDLFDRVLR
jgi:glycosyltransferase involved in cell wall biosynthesis